MSLQLSSMLLFNIEHLLEMGDISRFYVTDLIAYSPRT